MSNEKSNYVINNSNINSISKELFIKCIRLWDWKAYKSSNIKLHNLTDNELLIHVLDHSIPIEKWKIFIKKKNKNFLSANTIINNFDLLLPKDFDWKNYIALNKDIKNNEKYAKVHYILYGNLENREYKNTSSSNKILDNKIEGNNTSKKINIVDASIDANIDESRDIYKYCLFRYLL